MLKKFMMALFAFALMGVTTSCNKDDDNGGGSNDSRLVGTWQISKVIAMGQDVTTMIPEVRITLNADGTGVTTIDGHNDSFHWRVGGNSFTVNTGEEEISCTITNLTQNECTFTSSNMSLPEVGAIPGEVTITMVRVGGGGNNYNTLIVGTWQVTQTIVNGQDYTAQTGDVKLTFNADGRGLLNDNGDTQNNGFNWSISGKTMTISPDHDSGAEFTIVSLDGQTCTFMGTKMPGVSQTFEEVCITMVKTGGDNPNPNPDGTLVGTRWMYHTEGTETDNGYDYIYNLNDELAFTTATTGIMTESGHITVMHDGSIVDSGDINDSAPFTYTYNESYHEGTITATYTDDGETYTANMNFSYNADEDVIVVTIVGEYSQTMVFHRASK